jgi:Tol biopolymer transport system component
LLSYSQNIDPDWSPDGDRIVFAKRTNGDYGEYRIHVMNADGSNQIQLTEVAGSSEPKWSPNGKKIMYNSNMNGTGQIYVMDPDGSDKRKLTEWKVLESGAQWSPSGDRIAFMAARDKNTQVYIFNADGSNPVQVAKVETNLSQPIWSPDGNYIVSQSIGGLKSLNYLRTNLVEGKNEFILSGNNIVSFCGWTKTMDKIIYKRTSVSAPMVSTSFIYMANPDESKPKKVTRRIDNLYKVSLSPDGSKLLCTAREKIFVVDIITGKRTTIGSNFHAAVWSPDGTAIVMVSDGLQNIFTVNTDGTSLKQLTF